ncbi:hypothetical protein [Acidicapsa ligni]|uniref:hypothetical protein n=1 Tax=Acidicapsa ligni TaxID=542300 RepID=UPI0021DF96DE|nr:hypothetical protein [Acidicapsa ligni]
MCVHKKVTQVGRAMLMVTAGLMAAGLLAAQLHAQSFILSQNGKSVGKANLSLKQAAGGFDASSEVKIDMPDLKYNFSNKQILDGSYHLRSSELKGSVNGTSAMVTTIQQGTQFLMKINANGQATNTPLTFHPQSVLYPDFDPGALQLMLYLGAARNNRDIWAIIPKQAGSISALRIATDADRQGTLDGVQIPVHHFTVTLDTTKAEVFSSPRNELLQAEWSDEGFAIVRDGFKLTPPARPSAPPPAPAQPPAGQQGQQAQPNGQAPQQAPQPQQ